MENEGFSADISYSDLGFYVNYSQLKEQLKSLKRKNTSVEKYDPHVLCLDIKRKILDFEDEPNLSYLQNKIRKLNAGFNLFGDMCILQRQFSSLEIKRAVWEVLEKEKYQKMAKRIISRRQLETKRERYFFNQAMKTIRYSEENKTDEGEEAQLSSSVPEKISETENEIREDVQDPRSENGNIITSHETSIMLDVTRPETGRTSAPENMDPPDENLHVSAENAGRRTRITELPEPCDVTIPELPPRHIDRESELNMDLEEIKKILEDGVADVPEDITDETGISEPIDDLVNLDNLPPITTPPEKRRKLYPPKVDCSTEISDYADRARKLNKSISVERVQVYEGPPSILHAFTLEHVLDTPGVNNVNKTIRSSVLERLYKRNMKTDKKPHKDIERDFSVRQSAVEEAIRVTEGVALKRGSDAFKSHLVDITAVQPHLSVSENRESMTVEAQMERLLGTPVSKILQKEVGPPHIGPADPFLPPPSPRLSNPQGTTLDPPTAEPQFKTVEQRPPSEKWREFRYVKNCVNEIWREKEANGMVKSATVREILEKEGEWYKENILTLIRVMDKLSLRRELIIKTDGENVMVQPFEIPFVTEKQIGLRHEDPKF